MIYLLTENSTKSRMIIVSDMEHLPINSSHKIDYENNAFLYKIEGEVFAGIIKVPTNLEDEILNTIKHSFGNYVYKKFDDKDFFSSYLIYVKYTDLVI